MATKNDITGDSIVTKTTTNSYRDSWERIFGNKPKKARYAHGSMMGTFYVPCEIIERIDEQFVVIKFYDNIIQEESIRTVESKTIDWE